MFRSLHMKLVMVLVLLIVSVMAVVGTFLITSTTTYNMKDFRSQMELVFTPEFILSLEKNAGGADGASALRSMLAAYAGPLGIDKNRTFYVLDGETGEYLAGSDDSLSGNLPLSPNIIKAMNGEVGQDIERLGSYFDVAIPILQARFVVGVMDNKAEFNEQSWNLFTILIQAMLFGLLIATLLSFLLSKTITNPVERLTEQAEAIARGNFAGAAEIYSTDEIGVLTQTFNEMAQVLETALREMEGERDKLGTLFLHMTDGVVAFDRGGAVLHENPAAEKMLGRPISLGMSYGEVFPSLQLPEEMKGEDGRYIEVDYKAGKRDLKIYFAPFGTGEEEGLLGVLHDVTEQQRLDASRREFVANVSHELRTPLTNIRGYTETLIDATGELDSETELRFLGVIHSEADRMTRIVKDLLTLSQFDYDRMMMNMSTVSLCELALSATRAMELEAKRLGVTLVCDVTHAVPHMWGDRERIEQVVINIISNAVKYNRTGGSVTVSGGQTGDGRVFLRVTDTGIGVPEEDLPRLFERFYRVDKARSRERGGTGLGLAIAREIVEHHGGTIDFQSKFGEGSVVTLYFPELERRNHA